MQYNSIETRAEWHNSAISLSMVLNPSFIQFSEYHLSSIKKVKSQLSLPSIDGKYLTVFRIKTANTENFFKNPSCSTSSFKKMFRNYLMSNEKIVELHVGEETNDVFYDVIAIKFLSTKGKKEIKLAIETPNSMRSYTEETRKKYFSDKKKEDDNQS